MKLSLPKQDALARAQAAQRQAAQARRESLRVPKPFADAAEFLAAVRAIAQARAGVNRQIADACQVSTSTVSKWLLGKKVPQQAALDHAVHWWRQHRDDVPASAATAEAQPRQISLARLPEALSARLRRAARLRGVKPLEYAIQILDRKLPRMDEMI